MKLLLQLILTTAYLFSATVGEQVVVHLCQDISCGTCTTDEEECCGGDETDSAVAGDCCTNLVIYTHVSPSDVTAKGLSQKVEASSVEPEFLVSQSSFTSNFCTEKSEIIAGVKSIGEDNNFQKHHLIYRRVLYS